jgi:hypothetical protein
VADELSQGRLDFPIGEETFVFIFLKAMVRGYLLYGFDLLVQVRCFLLQVLPHFIWFVSNDSDFSTFCLHTTIINKLSHATNSLIGNFNIYHCLFCKH